MSSFQRSIIRISFFKVTSSAGSTSTSHPIAVSVPHPMESTTVAVKREVHIVNMPRDMDEESLQYLMKDLGLLDYLTISRTPSKYTHFSFEINA